MDVDIDGPRLAGIVIAPDVLQQLVAPEDIARSIVTAWILTIPAAGIIAATSYLILHLVGL